MKENSTQAAIVGGSHSKLAVKITGIVFWGLVVTGLLLALILLKDVKTETASQIESATDRAAFLIHQKYYQTNAALSRSDIAAIRTKLNLKAIAIGIKDSKIVSGDIDNTLSSESRTVLFHKKGTSQGSIEATITVYFDNPKKIIADKRKHMLTTMGVLFVVFGLILQWVLQRVLTAPFTRMVEVSKAISAGTNTLRFDESRNDEFGYLSKFINKSLDYLGKQNSDIEAALERIRHSEVELYEEKERAEVTLHSIGDAVITTDEHGLIEYLNPVAERLTGWTMDELHGLKINDALKIYNENDKSMISNPVAECLDKGEIVELSDNCVLLGKDGTEIPISDSAAPIRDHSGIVIGAVLVFQDVTQTRAMAHQLSYQAKHDPLTDLFNRREFEQQLEIALEQVRQENGNYTVCYLDLDQFKIVNDTCGHAAGDELLRQLPALLKSQLRENDILARLGGDEMGVLLCGYDREHAIELAEKLRAVIKDFRFVWEDHVFEIGVSIGVVFISKECRNIAELLSAADVACYTAKDLGRNRIHVYERDDTEYMQRESEMRWAARISRALNEHRLILFTQPIIPSAQSSNNPIHYEVLVRMIDEEGNLIYPDLFIPAAERFNIITDIDRYIITAAFDFLAQLPSSIPCRLSINLSGQSVGDPRTLSHIIAELDRTGIAAEIICFEITETAAMTNMSMSSSFIHTLKKRGCMFALDDFGSGLSSFAYLKNLNVDYLKIDGCFVRNLDTDITDHAMVEAIAKVGNIMGIETIAEFVESESILSELVTLGINYVQGHHISLPTPIEQWEPYSK